MTASSSRYVATVDANFDADIKRTNSVVMNAVQFVYTLLNFSLTLRTLNESTRIYVNINTDINLSQ